MEEIFISDLFELDDELDQLGVFDAIITTDSHFFINLLRLKNTEVPQFKNSYNKINNYFDNIIVLLDASQKKRDKCYRTALKSFSFSGVKGINLGFSETGVDAGFGKVLSEKVISDAFEIVKSGSNQPQIFQLVGLFEDGVAADRLSDMIATLISDDIHEYTRWVNEELDINGEKYPKIQFEDGIAINPYKGCELLYLPVDILHELPIARDWNDIDRAVSENRAIRDEVNEAVGKEWYKMKSSLKKDYLKEHIFMDRDRCARVIDEYEKDSIGEVSLERNFDYFFAEAFRKNAS